jgi:hypothetical protein
MRKSHGNAKQRKTRRYHDVNMRDAARVT